MTLVPSEGLGPSKGVPAVPQGEKEGLDVELVEKGGQVLLEARRALLPYIREGNVACSGRLRSPPPLSFLLLN